MERLVTPANLPQQAETRGIGLQYQYVNDLSAIPSGPPGEPSWFSRYTWTLSAAIDFRKTMGWSGTSGYVSVKQHGLEFGETGNSVAQGYSNLDTDPHTTLYEAWLQQTLGGKLTLKAGRIDANVDFDAAPAAADFLNSSMGYSPTLMGFPSYPAPQPAVELSAAFPSATRLSAGEFRTTDGWISLLESNRSWHGGADQSGGSATMGMWHLTKPLTRLDGTPVAGTSGFYGVLEQALWTRPSKNENTRTLAGYLQLGTGDKQVNPCSEHLGGGLVISGPLGRRPVDSAGIAASWVHLTGGSETVLEAYYKLSLSRSVSLVPDLQYFRNPQGSGDPTAMIVITPRLVITF
jgi:carbohydrate-selective porin OprB